MKRITKLLSRPAEAKLSTKGILFSQEALELGSYPYGARVHILASTDSTMFEVRLDRDGHKIAANKRLSVTGIEEHLKLGTYETSDGFLFVRRVDQELEFQQITDEPAPQDTSGGNDGRDVDEGRGDNPELRGGDVDALLPGSEDWRFGPPEEGS